ncbi:MAG: response regulator, partial [Chthoniobacteraceae bacterium]
MSDPHNLIPPSTAVSPSDLEKASLRNMRILVIDDEPVNVALLLGMLAAERFHNIESTNDSRQALEFIRKYQPDLIILDLMMPWVDGFEIMEGLAAQRKATEFLPIMVVTADITEVTRKRALSVGATDFLTKPFNRTECILRISNLLATRRIHLELADHNERLEEKVFERTAALEDALTELRAAQQQVVQRERLSALGAMVTGIAHDFNNSLALILGHGEKLQEECRQASITGEMLDVTQTIITAALDAADAVSRLRTFHRAPESRDGHQPLAMGEMVEQVVEFTRLRWEAESHARGTPIDVFCDLGRVPPVSGVAS